MATWNIRGFDRYTPKWRSGPGDSPIRDRSNIAHIAEIVSRFDVIAIQELRRSATAFLAMLEVLGPDWAFLTSDVTEGDPGNNERLAFVYDTRRLRPSGLACELVTAPHAPLAAGVPAEGFDQFARTPYAVSFARGTTRFTLATVHIRYGNTAADRAPELTALAQWLARWSAGPGPWGTNLMTLGDFNIDRRDDPLYQAFTSTGLRPPDALNFIPRTIFDDPDRTAPPDRRHFYDQIAGSGGLRMGEVLWWRGLGAARGPGRRDRAGPDRVGRGRRCASAAARSKPWGVHPGRRAGVQQGARRLGLSLPRGQRAPGRDTLSHPRRACGPRGGARCGAASAPASPWTT
ncbi:endonuclease/exonuclease/phosphatase family protein [Pseudonocardia charpentierae]|uniref:Endonuclease/exonuclease/phosphatase family protein n=1 Tax=Pseudonocardia charpentierae TaxID=3075545 RepID=A0ABU2NJ04_9PSEU|nr:endonuclease/exonuclease/phosphatase family protein [Pseudonocardia sp. DSM 45834]MDT0353957.1 endonuclease/exonuclease/phosphatase family protein [Pseudonocardia sp. DSM 45834]